MAQSLELLLIQFLMPDNDARRQAEEQIRRLARDPQVVPALVHHLRTAKTPNVRQLAAVLLRKKITSHWPKLPPDSKASLKQALIDSITLDHRFFAHYLSPTLLCKTASELPRFSSHLNCAFVLPKGHFECILDLRVSDEYGIELRGSALVNLPVWAAKICGNFDASVLTTIARIISHTLYANWEKFHLCFTEFFMSIE